MLGLFCAFLVLVWALVFLTAFCPLRTLRRRRQEAQLRAGLAEAD